LRFRRKNDWGIVRYKLRHQPTFGEYVPARAPSGRELSPQATEGETQQAPLFSYLLFGEFVTFSVCRKMFRPLDSLPQSKIK